MNTRKLLGALRWGALIRLHRRPVLFSPTVPCVTFCFDDFPRSAFWTGGMILSGLGCRATYYAAMGLIDTKNDLGEQFNRLDLEILLKEGHELASHTYSHVSCRRRSVSVFAAEVRKGWQTLTETVGPEVSKNFAYPFGEVTFAAKRDTAALMRSCRGTYAGVNTGWIDLNLLRANCLYGGISQFVKAKELIVANRKAKSWLIFYTHDVRGNPSRFGCTPELLKTALSCALDHGSEILTVEQVMLRIQTLSAAI
jgi:peptidoglycan/xylan/chitin deacetylase (PgdA/CDA1 family)